MTVNVEVFGRQVTVWVEDLKCSLKQSQGHCMQNTSFPQMYSRTTWRVFLSPPSQYLCDGVAQRQHSSDRQHTLYTGLALQVT